MTHDDLADLTPLHPCCCEALPKPHLLTDVHPSASDLPCYDCAEPLDSAVTPHGVAMMVHRSGRTDHPVRYRVVTPR